MPRLKALTLAALLCAVAPAAATAHAFLETAVPGVGSTVNGPPAELTLSYTQRVVVALASVRIAGPDGAGVAVGKPVGDGSSSDVLRVQLRRRLPPGTYVVTWHVVSVDTHPTSGSYRFTITP